MPYWTIRKRYEQWVKMKETEKKEIEDSKNKNKKPGK